MKNHQLTINQTFTKLKSGSSGLPLDEVTRRQLQYGKNEIQEKKKVSPWQIFIRQFFDFMILILILAAVISGYLGDITDTVIIIIIVFLNAIIGFYQEYKAEKAMDALKKLSALHSVVIRENSVSDISSIELVPGDIVLLETGNAIPADIRLIETYNLKIDESTLTGESLPVEKTSKPIEKEEVSIGDLFNLAFKGTTVTQGRAKGIVLATGSQTELGRIASLLQMGESKTPLQLRMTDFSKKLSYIILGICLILFLAGWLRGEDPLSMLMLSISLAVAAIPEALPALITIALASGSARMVRKNALIRKLPAVETLGSVNYICSDKTGTLTMNKMTVIETYAKIDENFDETLNLQLAMLLNNDVMIQDNIYTGDPTEIALAEYVNIKNTPDEYDHKRQKFPRIEELPFDSERKCMSTIHRWHKGYLVITKGAPESIEPLLEKNKINKDWKNKVNEWSSMGLRVLLFAYKYVDKLPQDIQPSTIETGLRFAGVTGIMDPAREEVKEMIAECKSAGIKTIMITGDHQSTAISIARTIGIWEEDSISVTGPELKALKSDDFKRDVEKIAVYARVSPEQKLSIVKALQAKNNFIAMTGDGVNDAPALKAANIGIAMGLTGTDVSKEAADMILLDDNFATIVKAVKEGRRIFDNIRKFVKYIMTCNGAEIWTIMLAPLIGLPIPLLPIHILWINLVTDGLPGIALASEKAEPDIMSRPPRKFDESLFAEGIGLHIVWVGLLMAGITLSTQAWAIGNGLAHWQTMVFTVLAFSQLGHVLAIRSERTFLYKQGIFTNLPLIGAVVLTVLLQLTVIYLPYANQLLKTQPLTLIELLSCIGLSAIVFHAVEFEKYLKSRKSKLTAK